MFKILVPQVTTLFVTCLICGNCCYDIPVEAGAMELPVISDGDRIISHSGYVTCYDAEHCIPEWVAYELTAEETRGDSERDDKQFKMDPLYKSRQAMREDYTGSGWTKGHMAPAADFRWDDDAMDETFYLTNVCPQTQELNAGDWQYLEKQVRKWARQYDKVWVVSGPIIGNAKNGTIGEHKVVVPDSFYKAVLVHTGAKYESIGFVMGNDKGRYYLKDCAVSVNRLEEVTGKDFFHSLDDGIEERVEDSYDLSVWSIK